MSITAQSFFAKLAALVGIAAMLAFSTVLSLSKDPLAMPVAQWFTALETGGKAAFETLIDDEAVIELKVLGITQSKAEFIESLDQWVELNKGASILTRQVSTSDTSVVVEVCYRFASNEVHNLETYLISGEKIAGSVQEQIGETCEGF